MTITESRTPEQRERPGDDGGRRVHAGAFNPRQMISSLPDALRKLNPRDQLRNPVMMVVWVGSVLSTVFCVTDPSVFSIVTTIWLWFTVLFANLAEAVAEGRGKAQAATLRKSKKDTVARRLTASGAEQRVPGIDLKIGDLVVVEAGEVIPGDGDVIEGIATVDESA
ncbi:MAG TPA: potassium-transporting ATPase subunit B, partial [Pseudonocardiaceae bacterium]|nr:potassium-transporting ATPase subunit B [Pseudonocardiaceae bacterium]